MTFQQNPSQILGVIINILIESEIPVNPGISR